MDVDATDSDMRRDLSTVRINANGLHGVDLIQESSRDDVLLDVEAGAWSDPGDLTQLFERRGVLDRKSDLASFAGETAGCIPFDEVINNPPDTASGRRI
jgi:hypothetical protein